MVRLRMAVGDRDPSGVEGELRRRLYEHNAAVTGIDDGELLVLDVHDPDDRLVAGLFGWTWGGCGYVDLLWVADGHRGAGLGARLLAAAEDEARARGCRQMLLATHSFQAPGFYARHGYRECGRYEGYPVGGHQVQLAKPLDG